MSLTHEQKQLLDEIKHAWESEFKVINDRIDNEIKQYGHATAESKQALARVQDRLDDAENRYIQFALGKKRGVQPVHVTPEFEQYLRKGDRLNYESKAALNESDDSMGGYLAPSEYAREILKGVVEYSPLRDIVRVVSTSAHSIKWPKRTGVLTAQWIGEQGGKVETTGLSYGLEDIPTHELYALADMSNWLVEDNVFNVDVELANEFSEQFGVAEGAAFVSGDGVAKPEGFLSNATVVAGAVTTSTNDTIVSDDLIDLYYAVKTVYSQNGTWVLNRDTIKRIRKLKDAQGNYLWQPGVAGLSPATILDRPYVEAKDMPTVSDQALAVAFGDFRRAYIVVDRLDVAVTRDPFTQMTVGAVRFLGRRRVGGQVVLPEAIKLLKVQ